MIYLAWRNLLQSRTQFILGVGGVALALLLMLSLDALLAGSEEDLVAYIEQSGADIFVAQEGVKNMHMAASTITLRDMRVAAQHILVGEYNYESLGRALIAGDARCNTRSSATPA